MKKNEQVPPPMKLIGDLYKSGILTGKRESGLLTKEDELIKRRIEYKDTHRVPLTKRQWRKKLERVGLSKIVTEELFDDIDNWKIDDE